MTSNDSGRLEKNVFEEIEAFWCRVYTIDKRQQTFGANVE
jgi:hypothetical protein